MKPIFIITTPVLDFDSAKSLQATLVPIEKDYHVVYVVDPKTERVTCEVFGVGLWFWLTHLFKKKPKLPS